MQQQIGRYEIRREIGRGGMATVYLAYDPRFQRQVAIKVLPRQFTHDPKYLARFEQEARMIAALEHPAIVPVYDFGEHNDAPYLVMRYMAGGSLRDRLSGEPLSMEEIAAALERLAPALNKAHNAGIVHRDLKPANILFDEDGNPYLADFGIARLAEASQTMTVVGTPAYMSPEQVEGDLSPDGRVDIYALGVILYELLTGQQPYTAETPTKQMMAHVLKPVPNALEANPQLPAETQTVIEKAMAKDREERYATAAELMTAVNELAGTAPSGEIPVGPSPVAPQEDDAGAPAPPPLIPKADDTKRDGIPGWIWWVGALLLLTIVVFTARSIFGGNGEAEQMIETATMEVVEKTRPGQTSATNTAIALATEAIAADNQTHDAREMAITAAQTQEAAETQTVEAEAALTREAAEVQTAEAQAALTREAAETQTAESEAALTREAAETQTAESEAALTREAAETQTAESEAALTREAAIAQTVEAAVTETAVAITEEKTITFMHFPDGSPINDDVILDGDEFSEWGFEVAGSPETSYCADAKNAAIRRNAYGIGTNFLTPAGSDDVVSCNGIPIEITFTRPVREVRLTFAGAERPYELKVYNSRDNLIGKSTKTPAEVSYSGETYEIDYSSDISDISRLTFGYEKAITAIIEIYYK